MWRRTWARYGAVQIVGYLIDFLTFILLFRGLGAPVLAANVAAKACAATATFFGQKYITFGKADSGRGKSEALLYFSLVAVNGVLASGLLLLFRNVLWTEAAKIVADGIVFVLSYVVTKHIVFGDRGAGRT